MPNRIFTRRTDPRAYRSGLEDKVAAWLAERSIPVQYEVCTLPYVKPESLHKYTPDFILPNGIVLETKGIWDSADRGKAGLIHEQHPALDLRFVFSNARARIGKKSKTTYAAYCEKRGFIYAHREVPEAWLTEPYNAASMAVIQQYLK